MTISVAINGFGRIGRQIARLILSNSSSQLRLVAINSLEHIDNAAFLLKHDSSHGIFPQQVKINGNTLQVGKNPPINYYRDPLPVNLPWKSDEVDLVFESTGQFTRDNSAAQHLQAGAQKVVITAAADFPDITICHGVNNSDYDFNRHNIVSASSCTTNCIAPIAKIIEHHFGFISGMATFLHSYTSSQPLLDGGTKDLRRSRGAGLNIIPTTTSAEQQLPIVLPACQDKFKALAIRVPTSLTHLADFTVKVKQPPSRDKLFDVFQQNSAGAMHGIISLSNEPLVSIDFKNSQYSSVIDVEATKVYNDLVKMMIWHNNEYSYCCRIIDLAVNIAYV